MKEMGRKFLKLNVPSNSPDLILEALSEFCPHFDVKHVYL